MSASPPDDARPITIIMPSTPEKSLWQTIGPVVVGAILAGVFSVGAVVVGGRISDRSQKQTSQQQADALNRQRHNALLGTSRLMAVEFDTRIDAMNAALGPHKYPLRHIVLDSSIPLEDEGALASDMSHAQWKTVSTGLQVIGRALRLLDRHPGQPLRPNDLRDAPDYRTKFEKAERVLNRFEPRS